MVGKKWTMWGASALGLAAAAAMLSTFNDQPSESIFRRGSTSLARQAAADAALAAAQAEVEAQDRAAAGKSNPADKSDPGPAGSSTGAAGGKSTASAADPDASTDPTKADDADEDDTDKNSSDKPGAATATRGKKSASASSKEADDDLSGSSGADDLTDPLDDGSPIDDPLASLDTFSDEKPILTADDRPFVIGGETGPKMPTDHTHWLKGSIFNARVTVFLNGTKLGDYQTSQDKDITWKLKKGLNTVTFVYTPQVKSASAHLDILESEHDPPVPPLASFRSTALSRLPGYTQTAKKDDDTVSRTFAFIAH
jgi:hypothetical protein